MKMKKILLILIVLFPIYLANAQVSIMGTVRDAQGNPIEGAEVVVENTDVVYYTEADGSYNIQVPTEGDYTLKVAGFNFSNISKKIKAKMGKNIHEIFIPNDSEGTSVTTLDAVVVDAQANKANEVSLLNVQKKALAISENIGAVQLSKQGVGNVATAVTKATSTVKQQGSSTFSVRGLLDRYNTTSLNGLPIPSNDPENKNIDLSLLKTDIVQYIGIEKVFSPYNIGDFGGANINIVSKEFSGKPYLTLSLGSSANLEVVKQKDFYLSENQDFLGFNQVKTPRNSLEIYDFNSWNFEKIKRPLLNLNMSLEGGRSFNVLNRKLNAFFYAGFDNDYTTSKGIEGNYNSQGNKLSLYETNKNKYTTNATGLVNLFYKINANHKLKFTSNYIHSSEQEVKNYYGYHYDWAQEGKGVVRRGLFKTTQLFVNQLGGKHNLNEKFELNWIAGYNVLHSERPNRISNKLIYDGFESSYKLKRDGGSSNRYFDDLKDNELAANLDLKYFFSTNLNFDFGYQGRFKDRKFWSKQYDFEYTDAHIGKSLVPDIHNIDQVLNAERFSQGFFNIRSNFLYNTKNLTPMSFNGSQNVNAGYVSANYKFGPALTAQLGVRLESVNQNIAWKTNLGSLDGKSDFDTQYTKFLPSLNLKYKLDEYQNIKLSLSRTYTMPQLKELAYYIYDDISEQSQGNPFLKPSDNNNLDIKWEVLPKNGELFSIGLYTKYIQNPISKALVGESLYSYLNIGDQAYVYGIEAEIRKDLWERNQYRIYTFANVSYLQSKTDLNNDKIRANSPFSVNFNKDSEQLEGATNFVANANVGIDYNLNANRGSMLNFVISYSYVGKHLYSIGTQGLGRVVEQPLNLLDAVLKLKLNDKISFGLKAKNLLNPKIERIQENQTPSVIYQYKNGTELGLGLSYQF